MVMLENILDCPEIDGVLLGSDWGTQIDLIMSRNGGFIFSPSQSIQGDVPAENILALIEVAQEGR